MAQKRKVWEYREVSFNGELQDELDEPGLNGWEAVGFAVRPSADGEGGGRRRIVLLKREVQ